MSATPPRKLTLGQRLYPPFVAFGAIDVYLRVLLAKGARVDPPYRLRVVVGFVFSFFLTLVTLPERVLVGLWLRLTAKAKLPGPLVILGYYRSGTTHLQFLLSRDPNLVSPTWNQALSPAGWVISWSLLKWVFLPFFPDKRPQDNAAFGADIPAEDDFALANDAAASPLIGRHMLARMRDDYDRWHDLSRLTPAELARWRRSQRGFVRKIALLAGGRRVLLKTPAHTARVPHLEELFKDTDGVRYIHISRKPDAVLASNIGLHRVLNELYALQEPLPDDEIERRIVAEYLATEENFLAAKKNLPPGRLAELRLEDLTADPVGQIKRLYAELGMEFTDAFEQRLLEYLDANRGYETNKHPPRDPNKQAVASPLEPLRATFGHDRPAVAKSEPPLPRCLLPENRARLLARASFMGVVTACVAVAAWVGVVWLTGVRLDGLSWLLGIAVGSAMIRTARRGTAWLGWLAVALTLAAHAAATTLTSAIRAEAGTTVADWLALSWAEWEWAVAIWLTMGVAGAYRLATKRWV